LINVLFFFLILFIPYFTFINSDYYVFAFVAPFFLIKRLLRPLFAKNTYGTYELKLTKKDRRYKSGGRPVAYLLKKDKNKKKPFTKRQLVTARLEFTIKALCVLLFVLAAYQETSTVDFALRTMTTEKKLEMLSPGDSLILKENRDKSLFYSEFELLDKSKAFDLIGTSTDTLMVYKGNKLLGSQSHGNQLYFEVSPPANLTDSFSSLIEFQRRLTKRVYVNPKDVKITRYNYNQADTTNN